MRPPTFIDRMIQNNLIDKRVTPGSEDLFITASNSLLTTEIILLIIFVIVLGVSHLFTGNKSRGNNRANQLRGKSSNAVCLNEPNKLVIFCA